VKREQSFRCVQCRIEVAALSYGTRHRNHCPACLWSKHVDERPGDRASACGGKMEPIAVAVRHDEWALIHRCAACGQLRSNRIAGDDHVGRLLALAAQPLANPPFPLDPLPV
jgi:hypothetical protein